MPRENLVGAGRIFKVAIYEEILKFVSKSFQIRGICEVGVFEQRILGYGVELCLGRVLFGVGEVFERIRIFEKIPRRLNVCHKVPRVLRLKHVLIAESHLGELCGRLVDGARCCRDFIVEIAAKRFDDHVGSEKVTDDY
jgi:hypothetical protein